MKFVHPDQVNFSDLHKTFLAAFSDYKAPLQVPPQQFRTRIFEKLNIINEYSVVAMNADEMPVGFIFHTKNRYKNVETIYNGGTGVIPSFRKQKVATRMYEWIMPNLLKSNAEQIILEVISDNVKAIEFYKNLGFEYLQTFRCFKQPVSLTLENKNLSIVRENDFSHQVVHQFKNYKPSFVDTVDQIHFNWHNEILLKAYEEDKLQGYVYFQPKLGRISQIGFEKTNTGEALLKAASQLSDKKGLTILNIPEEDEKMLNFLDKMGFRNEIDQFEMVMKLK